VALSLPKAADAAEPAIGFECPFKTNSVEKLDLNYGAEWFRNEQTGFSISWFSF
jgi:hypothetical protein